MKFLDEAAINYGKAVDDKPSEKYFLEPRSGSRPRLLIIESWKRQEMLLRQKLRRHPRRWWPARRP